MFMKMNILDKDPMSYLDWADGEPAAGNECGSYVFATMKHFTALDCDSTRKAMCQQNRGTILKT